MDLKSFLDLEREFLTEERNRLDERCPGYPINDNAVRARLTEFALCHPAGDIKEKDGSAQCAYTTRIGIAPEIKEKDDMDQWISDTFYSHFPGFNNEYQNRQLHLQKRQLENQENLIKHQMLNAGQCRKSKYITQEKELGKQKISSACSNNSSITSNGTVFMHENQKPDIHTKQNNSSRDDSLSSVRSGSSRYKLLQDLRHTNLANMINRSNEDEFELNRKEAEIVTARKKQYQQELMQQIEEKRRTIKLLKDKEIQQEKVLTRRLEEQLKTMKLEEKLEKERLKATKIRYDAEQNHLLREHLLSKLENDSKLLQNAAMAKNVTDNEINKENVGIGNDNKVYKYFSNSEKHEYNYRKKSGIPVGIDITADLVDLPKIERECFHLSEKICPACDEPLREFDEYCLRCQNKNTLHSKTPPAKERVKMTLENHSAATDICNATDDFGWISNESGRSFHFACIKCERFYKLCPTCLKKSDVCKACQSKRNVCMNCRSSLCSFCLEEIACGKDTETLHVNESERLVNAKKDSQNNGYIQVVSVNNEADSIDIGNKSLPRSILPLDARYLLMNNLNVYEQQPNIGRATISQQSNITSSHYAANAEHNVNNSNDSENNITYSQNDNNKDFKYDEINIERLRRDNDTRLSRYLKNYSELALQSRGTQTTPNSTARRDIVICGEHSLSIPLLREMPRMTRKENTNSNKPYSDDIENLKRRWEIPAVQKQSVSRTSPRVITQIGAVRRQLQTETLFSDGII